MASIVNYVADGATNQFQIPFTYINQADVVVTVNGTAPTFTFINSTTINITATPTSGAKVIIKRVTPLNALVDFTDGSTLFEADLDLAHQQNRLIAEESRDRADSAIATINANIDDVNTVAGIATNVTSVANNTTNVNSVANNMAEVLTADDNAATATTKAGEASASAATASAQATISTTKAGESATSAASSLASKNAASVSESNASASETASANSATASSNSASASASSAAQSSASETISTTKAAEAVVSANNSAVSATNSANSATTSTTKAAEASASQSASATSEANALSSKNAAATSETNAATSENNAATSETNAASSEAVASTKASEASTSETNAASSEANASSSASTATTQAGISTTKASESAASAASALSDKNDAQTARVAAETAETNAETSETNAASSASSASSSASSASSSAATSTTKAGEASTSEINAAASQSSATASAATATTQAGIATTKAGEASTSASNAASSASSAQASKDAALAALDSFDDRYLGQKANNPSTDNDGNTLIAGALYFNTTDDTMKVYEGSSWVAAYASLSGSVLQSNNLSDLTNAADARANLGLGTAATTAATAYATAAQGTTADNALPKSGGAMTGAITTNSTFDGVDVGQLKTDFDNLSTDIVSDTTPQLGGDLASNGNDINFADNDKAIFGAGSDLQIYHDGNNSYIQDQGLSGTGNLILAGADVEITTYGGDKYFSGSSNIARLYHTNNEKLATTPTGINVTGNVAVSGTVDGRDVASDGNKLDGIESNAKNDQTITAGSGLSGGGTGNVTLSHSDTSSQSSSNNSGRTYIQDITLDTYGHVTGLATATETVVNTNTTYSVGDGGLTQKNFTTTLKNKLDGIAASANNYSFPYTVSSSPSANTVVQRTSGGYIFANYMNITPNDVANGSITKVVVETGNDGYTRHSDATAMRTFLNVANGANNYTHPSGNGNNHIPSGGSSGQVLQYSSAGTAVWATPSSPDPFPSAPTWTSPDATYTSSGTWSKNSGIGNDDWVIFHLISGGGSGNAGGYGQGGKGGALVLAIKGVHVPSSISYVIGAGGGYNGYGGFANAGQPSTITISGKTFTSGSGGAASYYNNSGGHGDGVLAWPGGSSPATILTVDDVRGGGSLGGGTSNAGNAGSGGYYGAGGNGALRIHW